MKMYNCKRNEVDWIDDDEKYYNFYVGKVNVFGNSYIIRFTPESDMPIQFEVADSLAVSPTMEKFDQSQWWQLHSIVRDMRRAIKEQKTRNQILQDFANIILEEYQTQGLFRDEYDNEAIDVIVDNVVCGCKQILPKYTAGSEDDIEVDVQNLVVGDLASQVFNLKMISQPDEVREIEINETVTVAAYNRELRILRR